MTNGVVSARGGRLQKLVMENRKFTNTAIPVFSGTEGWYQHIHIVQAIGNRTVGQRKRRRCSCLCI